jgi:hypothetical protein
MYVDKEHTFLIGEDTFIDSVSAALPHAVVFEDNTETGYFYALSTYPNQQVLDALHIYDVGKVIDKDRVCKIQVAWTEDGTIASLLINDYCHAIFDFFNRAGFCRNAYPESMRNWAENRNRLLTDALIDELFQKKS